MFIVNLNFIIIKFLWKILTLDRQQRNLPDGQTIIMAHWLCIWNWWFAFYYYWETMYFIEITLIVLFYWKKTAFVFHFWFLKITFDHRSQHYKTRYCLRERFSIFCKFSQFLAIHHSEFVVKYQSRHWFSNRLWYLERKFHQGIWLAWKVYRRRSMDFCKLKRDIYCWIINI